MVRYLHYSVDDGVVLSGVVEDKVGNLQQIEVVSFAKTNLSAWSQMKFFMVFAA
jgi:hypothetical protein